MNSAYRLAFAALLVSVVFPCAIDNSPRFLPRHNPENIGAEFLEGHLGILTPELHEQYKVIAWRYLSGLPLSSQDQQSFAPAQYDPNSYNSTPIGQWDAIAQAAGSQFHFYGSEKASRVAKGVFYENCLPDAYATAVRTYNDRRVSYADPSLLNDWRTAQIEVFKNCSDDTPEYPAEPAPSLPVLARADRIYQIAAARFYAEDFAEAERRFREIAADPGSPWHDTAAYMIARTQIREYSLLQQSQALNAAKDQLISIGASPFHQSAQRLIQYLDAVADPAAHLKAVAASLSDRQRPANLADSIHEAAYLLKVERFRAATSDPDAPEVFSWARAVESPRADTAIARWRQQHSVAWLTAAIMHSKSDEPAAPELITAALAVAPDSPAHDTSLFHAVRLLIESNRRDEARRILNNLLQPGRRNLDSVDNAFRAERMSLASSFDDLLRWAPRRPVGYGEDDDDLFPPAELDNTPILDSDSIGIFNDDTPLAKLAAAAESNRLPVWPRTQLALTGWTRAFILGDNEIADRLAADLQQERPGWTADLQAFRTAPAGDAKRFAGALLIERHSDFAATLYSAFRPLPASQDRLGPYWWCADPMEQDHAAVPPEEAISAEERATAAEELSKIRSSGPAQFLLAPIVTGWANTHSADPRVPEALHRLVRVTRFGCRGIKGTADISKAAFQLLHSRYPDSTWAKETPYWFPD